MSRTWDYCCFSCLSVPKNKTQLAAPARSFPAHEASQTASMRWYAMRPPLHDPFRLFWYGLSGFGAFAFTFKAMGSSKVRSNLLASREIQVFLCPVISLDL